MNKIKYCVLQGHFTKSDGMEYWFEGEFDDLEEAQKHVREIYDNTDKISKEPNGYLETLIEFNEFEGNSVIDHCIIAKVRYYY